MPNVYRVQKRPLESETRTNKHLKQSAKLRKIHSIHRLPSPPSDQSPPEVKRKTLHDSDRISRDEPPRKRSRHSEAISPSPSDEASSEDQYGSEVCWEEYFGSWPLSVEQNNMSTREPRATKRSHTSSRSNSYSQRVRDGDSPAAWTRRHEEKMEEVGLFMTADRSQAVITDDCRRLCDRLLAAKYAMPQESAYRQNRLAKVLRRVRFRNEARVVRDVMPIVVPSPELLHIDGHAQLDNVCEAMNAEWTQCDTLCGPRPKPDFVAGISATTFTHEEKEKLQVNHTSACPNLFPENMYFPFLICEVKGSDRPIEEAERQAMHSASIATRAVIELFRKVSATAEVHQKILAFSVVHNHATVMIFAHFASIDGEKTSFFRRLLHFNRLAEDLDSTAWTKPYEVIRAIYEHFVPQHVDRIRSALSKMRSPSLASFATQLGIDEDSQASTVEQSSSQEDGVFKKPSLPSVVRLQEENDKLRDRLLDLLKSQQAEATRQRKEQHEQKLMMEEQLAQQKKESSEQKLMMQEQLAQQKKETREQKLMMQEQLAQQKREASEQKLMMQEQLTQQKTMMEGQMAQQQEIISLLKRSTVT